MLKYIRKLSPGDKSKAAILAIYGKVYERTRIPGDQGDPGSSVDHAMKIITGKGYDVFATFTAGYPHSITMAIPPPDEAEELLIRISSDKKIEDFATKIIALDRDIMTRDISIDLVSYPAGFLFRLVGRRFLGKMMMADERCTSCGKCSKACPAGAITMIKKIPTWNWDCQGCQRCINICPSKSIQTSIPRLIILNLSIPLVLIAIWAMGFFTSYGMFRPAGYPGTLYDVILFFISYIVLIPVVDKLLLAMELCPPLKKIMSLSFTRPVQEIF